VLPREMPSSGVYLFSERGEHLYVGRSNDLRGRYGRHGREGATWRQAAFAFQLARREIGNLKASYVPGKFEPGRFHAQPGFQKCLRFGEKRIREMEYRYVEEGDQNRQALLEIYCAVVLCSPFNDFATHWAQQQVYRVRRMRRR
jgi:hypothetical protein